MAEFKFRLPDIADLTRKQKKAIRSKKSIFITGVAGSGKTVVSVFRLQNSKSSNSALFTYGKLLRLAISNTIDNKDKSIYNIHRWHFDKTKIYLEKSFSDINIKTTIEWYKKNNILYDEVLVDEGQDLFPNSYKLFNSLSDNLSISADNAQQVYEHGASEETILEILPNLEKKTLNYNHRNTYEIYNFAKEFVPNNARANDKNLLDKFPKDDGEKPVIYIKKTLDDTVELIKQILNANKGSNIGILSEDIMTVNTYREKLKNNFEITSYTSEDKDVPTNLQNIVLTTFKSSKGMEFDVVIMPQFQHIRDKNSNQYYIGATRAKTDLYMIAIGKLPDMFENIDISTYKLIKNI